MPEQSQENPLLRVGPNFASRIIYFFGARHTNDPTDVQFDLLKRFFGEFLNVAKGDKIVFIEGAIREISQNYEEAIRQYGESGATQWLAREASIDVIHPEPNDEEQRKLLCVSFDPQVVAYTMIMQNLAGWFRHKSQTTFEEAVMRVLDREAKFSRIYGFTPDTTWFYDQHRRLFDEQQLEDKRFLDSISDPRKSDTVVNSVVEFRSRIRNEHILLEITRNWKADKSIFVVYGKGHLTTLGQALQKLVAI